MKNPNTPAATPIAMTTPATVSLMAAILMIMVARTTPLSTGERIIHLCVDWSYLVHSLVLIFKGYSLTSRSACRTVFR